MSLLDDPIQLLIVGAVVIVFFMYGPKKIPELARALGQAKNEFSAAAAQKPGGLSNLASALTSISSPSAMVASAPTPGSDAQLIETAERLGIPTQGKTMEQISNAIVDRAKGSS
jgi:sec-independent protein translocase protein TatA